MVLLRAAFVLRLYHGVAMAEWALPSAQGTQCPSGSSAPTPAPRDAVGLPSTLPPLPSIATAGSSSAPPSPPPLRHHLHPPTLPSPPTLLFVKIIHIITIKINININPYM